MQKHSNRSFSELLFDWKALPLLYVLSSLVLGVMGNALFSLLTNGLTTGDSRTLRPEVILFAGIFVVTFLAYLTFRVIRRVTRPVVPPGPNLSDGHNEAFQITRKGIIFNLGGQLNTLSQALKGQNPEWVGLICTAETQTVADDLLSNHGIDLQHIRKWTVNPKDVQAIRTGVVALSNWLLEDVRLPKQAIVIDVTGGTKPMSIGAFLASEALRVDTQYLSSKYDAANTPIPGTQDEILLTQYDVETLS